VDEDVGGFEVAVHDAFVVHVFECAGDLFHEVPDGGLVEGEVFAFLLLD
jgi:hypothetical protein